MGVFKVGDIVKEKDNMFGKGHLIGVVLSVNTFGFLAYRVEFKGIGVYEYHRGELKGIKRAFK